MLFVSMSSEIDTRMLFDDAWKTGRTVAVPRARMADRSMQAVPVRDLDRDMVRTPIGVLEPRGGDVLDLARIDLVIVPGLGFGPSGQRIGRGAGFYDRFLGDPALRAVRCGLAFDQQIIDQIPMTAHDTWLGMLVTESGVRRFSRGA
jgi:5-formyltetrahydrofolate cyclo-ligase